MDFRSLLRLRRNARSRIWIEINAFFFCPSNDNNFVFQVGGPSEYLTIVGILHIQGRGRSLVRYGGCQFYMLASEQLTMLSEANPGCGITIALPLRMKMNSARKVALLVAAVCALMLASVGQARAERHPLPPQGVPVPDAGATVMLLGAALGALGMARR